jgi:ATP-dependent Clp protease ATP-binding subunit ClpA
MTQGAKVGRVIPKVKTTTNTWIDQFTDAIIGQEDALDKITPYVMSHFANMSPSGRPAGVFLLMGPTGVGKTHTAEALAVALHGHKSMLLRIDCAEFQHGHEIAKLIGSPPGYLGHRETHALLSQAHLSGVTSSKSSLSIVVFDEIEKAKEELYQLLLGILDRAQLRLGDNSVVNFENTIIFLTSNLGSKTLKAAITQPMGFGGGERKEVKSDKLYSIASAAAKKHFSAEFINRLDEMVMYKPLSKDDVKRILNLQLAALATELELRGVVRLLFGEDIRKFLIARGYDPDNGAREMKRTIYRLVQHPLACLISAGLIDKDEKIQVSVDKKTSEVTFYRYNAMEQAYEKVR